MMEVSSPSSKERKEHIESGSADAVFDEGVKSWGERALDTGMRFLPINDAAARHMQKLGFPTAMLTRGQYPKLEQAIRCVDFSGWTFFCHTELPSSIAYEMAKAVDLCHAQIPVDHFDKRPMTMVEFCRGGEAGQLNIPLHPGAKKYFRERGYLLRTCCARLTKRSRCHPAPWIDRRIIFARHRTRPAPSCSVSRSRPETSAICRSTSACAPVCSPRKISTFNGFKWAPASS